MEPHPLIDISSTSGLVAATWALIAILARLRGPGIGKIAKLIKYNQEFFALIVCMGLAAGAKLGGIGFVDASWLELVINAVIAALATGVAHDKLARPLRRLRRE